MCRGLGCIFSVNIFHIYKARSPRYVDIFARDNSNRLQIRSMQDTRHNVSKDVNI